MKQKNILTFLAIIIAFGVISTVYFVTGQRQQISEVYAGYPLFLHEVNVLQPKPPQVREYNPDERIDVRLMFKWQYCGNDGPPISLGRITRPVPAGENHTNFGPWRVANGEAALYSASNWTRYREHYTTTIRTPRQPGVYKFKYQLKLSNDEGRGPRGLATGVITFKVRENDVCRNIDGDQRRVPRGYVQTRNANGLPICVQEDDLGLICSVSDASIEPGETVTFNATTDVDATFKWFDGADVTGVPVKTSSGRSSSLSRTYTNRGIYLVSVLAQSGTRVQQCVRGVTVRDTDDEDFDADDLNDLLDDIDDLDNLFIDEDGNIHFLDPSAGPATINFGFNGSGLTNTTCEAVWDAQNVLKCDLYRNGEFLKEIDFSGTDDVEPGSYYIQCLAALDGAQVRSETQVCRLNPGVSEV